MDEIKKLDSIFSATNGNERRALTKMEIVSIRILERWDECINLFQLWYENKIGNTSRINTLENQLEAVLYSIFLMNQELFRRKLKENVFNELLVILLNKRNKDTKMDHEKYFTTINRVFDDLGLVRVDYERIQKTLEQTNAMKGLD